MNQHVTQWLEAYYDGELTGRRAHQVEAHLEICPDCLAELESLNTLSMLLQQSPEPGNLTPPETFVAQVGLRLPRRPEMTSWQRALRAGWQWAPAGLLAAWIFVQTAFIVSSVLMWVLRVVPGGGQLDQFVSPETQTPPIFEAWILSDADWTEIGRFGMDLLRDGGPLGWGLTINLGLTLLLGVLYISWFASWWAQKSNEKL